MIEIQNSSRAPSMATAATPPQRSSEQQIIGIIKEHEAGAKVAELRRPHGISSPTLYNWKAKYGGLEASEATPVPAPRMTVAPWQ